MKRIPTMIRLPERDHKMLTLAAKAYRAPSVNWFVGEMIQCMLNPARWSEFATRLQSGSVQQTLELGQSLLQDTPPRKSTKAPSGHGERGGRAARKKGRHG